MVGFSTTLLGWARVFSYWPELEEESCREIGAVAMEMDLDYCQIKMPVVR